ncbi:MAG: META domain-containing protein, partial [Hyphomicrobiaceae bacterium]
MNSEEAVCRRSEPPGHRDRRAVLPQQAALAGLAAIALLAPAATARAGGLEARWSVTTLGGAPAVPAGDIRFEAGEVSGATACNHFRGRYQSSEADNSLRIEVLQTTRRGCAGEAAERERSFLESMANARRYRIEGSALHLVDGAGVDVAGLQLAPDATLTGKRHKIVSYLKNSGLYSIRGGTGAVVEFKDGKLMGSTGCTRFEGTYDATETTVRIVVAAKASEPEKSPCFSDLADQDAG